MHLDKVLGSEAFAGSKRARDLLRYLAEAEFEGRSAELKGYTIAVEALDQPDDFDPSTNSLVRTQMRNLRALLHRYYAGEGANDPMRFEVRKGETRLRFVGHGSVKLTAWQTLLTLFDGPVAEFPWLFTARVYCASLIATLIQIGAPLMFGVEAMQRYPVVTATLLVCPLAYTLGAVAVARIMLIMTGVPDLVHRAMLAAAVVAVPYWLTVLAVRWLGDWAVGDVRGAIIALIGALIICVGTFGLIAYTHERERKR